MLKLCLLSLLPSLLLLASPLRQTTTGFYPLWENTGYIEGGGNMYLSPASLHYGAGDIAQIGTHPVLFAYRTPNLQAKFQILKTETLHLSSQLSGYYLMPQAGKSNFSPNYTSRLDNPDFSILLTPLTTSLTLSFNSWLDFHNSLTLMPLWTRGPLQNETTLGLASTVELGAQNSHGLLFHWGNVGLWNYDFTVLGISYRYRNTWLEFKAGYFYRLREIGQQSAPLLNIALLL